MDDDLDRRRLALLRQNHAARRHHARRSSGDGITTSTDQHAITVHLDELLEARGMTLTDLAHRVGITIVNLSILKNGRAKAIRFTTLTKLCEALDCQPADLLTFDPTDRPD
jgi:putative transcriptional regulator